MKFQSQISDLELYYFSGTGNAKNVCHWIAEKAKGENIPVSIKNIADNNSITDSKPNATIGFCYPTHGFNAPPIVLKYLWRFPRAKANEKFFVVNTRAGLKAGRFFIPGLSGLALLLPAIFMLIKGYKLVGYRSIDFPSNWISLHPGLKDKVVNSIYERCKRITNLFTSKLLREKKDLSGFWWLPVDLILLPITIGYYFVGRFILSKTFIATNQCNKCNLCAENCPVKAIKIINGSPFWAYNCESCMKCMNSCPKRAIETPHGLTFMLWWIAFSIIPYMLLKYTIAIEEILPLIGNLISELLLLFISVFFIFLCYRLSHYMMRFNWFNNLIRYTSLTHFSFWRRYKAPKNFS